VVPDFPSLYSPNVGSTLGNTGHFLYQAYCESSSPPSVFRPATYRLALLAL
jgi:hypothetical protein